MRERVEAILNEELWLAAAVLLAALAGPATAHASETYYCDAAEREAIVGAFKTRKVAAYLNYEDAECRFSIDGAPVGSPPLEVILSGLDAIDGGEMSGIIASDGVELLANVMMAAAPVSSAPSEVVDLLEEFVDSVTECFKALEAQEVVGDVIAAENLLCRVAVPTGEPFDLFPAREAGRQGLRVVGQQPQLQLAVAFDNSEYFLFVPVTSR
ncbi:MAG: hypothetical protein ACREJ5_26690 [Geminicoccaceae bacterium]